MSSTEKVYLVYLLDASGNPEELFTFSYPTEGEAMDMVDDLYADGIRAIYKAESAAFFKWACSKEANSLSTNQNMGSAKHAAFLAGWRYAKRHTKRKTEAIHMKVPIDTKKIAERVKSIRAWRYKDGSVHELCGYVEQLLEERKELLVTIANRAFERGAEHRELTTVGE